MATAQDALTAARALLNDASGVFVSPVAWSDAELLRWITDAQREIVALKPESNPITALHSVADGLPRQRLDREEAYALVRVECNGEDYYIVSSRPYPVDVLDGLSASADIEFGYTVTPGTEAVSLVATITAGDLRAELFTYDDGAPEAIEMAAALSAGTLVVELVTYDDAAPEAIEVAADVDAGTLVVELLTYDDAAPEAIILSSQITAGTLT